MNHTRVSRQVEGLKELWLIEEERNAGIRTDPSLLREPGVRKSERPLLCKKFTSWLYLNTDTEPPSTEEYYEDNM